MLDCLCQTCLQGPPAEKTGRSLLNRSSCPPDDPVGQGTELNWNELKIMMVARAQGALKERWRRGRQRTCWMDNAREWRSLPMPKLLGWSPAKITGRGSLLNRRSCPTRRPNLSRNWAELKSWYCARRLMHSPPTRRLSVSYFYVSVALCWYTCVNVKEDIKNRILQHPRAVYSIVYGIVL